MGKYLAGVYTNQSNEGHALNKRKLIFAYRNYFNAKLKPMLHVITDYDKVRVELKTMALGNGYQLVTAIPRAAKKRHQREEVCIIFDMQICLVLMVALIA